MFKLVNKKEENIRREDTEFVHLFPNAISVEGRLASLLNTGQIVYDGRKAGKKANLNDWVWWGNDLMGKKKRKMMSLSNLFSL